MQTTFSVSNFPATGDFRVYQRRWAMLIFFTALSALNAMHWLQYSIITNVVIKYYGVSATYVNMSAMISMFLYIPLIAPAAYFIEKKGLRYSMILACLLTVIGSWLKLGSLHRDQFHVGFASQAIIGAGQIFILSVPPRLGAMWFDMNEVSTAGAIGVFGNQLGIALGFFIPTLVVQDSASMDEIYSSLMKLQIGYAAPPTILLLVIWFLFEDNPKLPPNPGQAMVRKNPISWSGSMKALMKRDYVCLLVSYGLNIGVFYTYSTLLNQMILIHYSDGEKDAGRIGLVLVISGAVGSLVWGVILDKTGQYRRILIGVYLCSAIGMVGFCTALMLEDMTSIYVTSSFLGFFMNAYQTIAFEFTSEVTYPVAESTSTGILIAMGELAGVILVISLGEVLEMASDRIPSIAMIVALVLGFFTTLMIRGKVLKRQAAGREGRS